ncbi:MAG: TIGR00730 family Rossman fold protein, partial [Flavobacteriales bacterium]|nr:TIGR00730 family Rossman fold protein [Flavobacteriales bacterium]
DLDLIQLVDSAEEAVEAIDDFYSQYLFKPNF